MKPDIALHRDRDVFGGFEDEVGDGEVWARQSGVEGRRKVSIATRRGGQAFILSMINVLELDTSRTSTI